MSVIDLASGSLHRLPPLARAIVVGTTLLAVATAAFTWLLHPQWFQYDSYHYMVLSMHPAAWAGHPLGFGYLLRALAAVARPFGTGAFAVAFQAWQLACLGAIGFVVVFNAGDLPKNRLGRWVLAVLALVTLDLVAPALVYQANGFMSDVTSLGILAVSAASFTRAVTRGGWLGWPAFLVVSILGYLVRYQFIVVPLVALVAVVMMGLEERAILRRHWRAATVCVACALTFAASEEKVLSLFLPVSEYGRAEPARYVASSVQCRLRCEAAPFEETCADAESRALIEETSCTNLLTRGVSLGDVKPLRASVGGVLGRLTLRRFGEWLVLAPLTYLSEVFDYPDWEGFAFDWHVRSLSSQVDVMRHYGELFDPSAVDAPSPCFRALRDAVDASYRKLEYHWLSGVAMLLALIVAWRARRPASLFLALSSVAAFLVFAYLHPQTPLRFLLQVAVPAVMALWIDLFQGHACEARLFDGASPLTIRNASLSVFLLGAGRLFGMALHGPLYAYADDGQLQRVARWFGLIENGELPVAHPAAPLAGYALGGHPDPTNALLTSDLLFVAPAAWASRLSGQVLGMRSVGVVRALCITTLTGAAVWAFGRRNPTHALWVAAAFALVIADPSASLFIDTLYPDYGAVTFGFAAVLALVHLDREDEWSHLSMSAAACALFGLALATDGTRFLPLMLVGAASMAWLCARRFSARHSRAALWLAAAATAGALVGGPRDNSVDRGFLSEARVNAWFTVVLPALPDQAAALEELGLPAHCRKGIGRSWYDLGGDGGCPEITQLSTFRAVPLLFRRPFALGAVLGEFTHASRPVVLQGYGQVEHRHFGKLRREPSVLAVTQAQLVEALPETAYGVLLWGFVLYAPARLAFLALRRRRSPQPAGSAGLVALLCSVVLGNAVFVAIFGGTVTSDARRFQLGALAFFPGLIAAVADAVARIALPPRHARQGAPRIREGVAC